jgi:hypothetical protein
MAETSRGIPTQVGLSRLQCLAYHPHDASSLPRTVRDADRELGQSYAVHEVCAAWVIVVSQRIQAPREVLRCGRDRFGQASIHAFRKSIWLTMSHTTPWSLFDWAQPPSV